MSSVVSAGNGSSGRRVLFHCVWQQCQPLPSVQLFIVKWCNMDLLQSYCFHRGKKLLQHVCHVEFYQFISVFLLFFFSQSGILLLRVGIFFFFNSDLYLKVQMLFQPLSKNPTTPNCSWYCFVSSSCLLKVSLLLCLHGKCNYCKHCLKSEFLVWWFHWSACKGRMRQVLKTCSWILWIFLNFSVIISLVLWLQQFFSFCIF